MAPTFRIHYTYERFVRFKFGSPLEHDAPGKARVDDFVLSYGNCGVELELFTGRGKAESWHSNKIKAYWLPWLKKTTTQLTLGDDAPFFFTSELTGCRIQIGGGPSSTVLTSLATRVRAESGGISRQRSTWGVTTRNPADTLSTTKTVIPTSPSSAGTGTRTISLADLGAGDHV
jgi:hypothetical protein